MDVNLLINFNNGFEILKIQSGQNGIELATCRFYIRLSNSGVKNGGKKPIKLKLINFFF